MIAQILCFLVLIICLVYGLALLSWLVMKLDIEKRRSKTKFFERIGENLLEIEKLKDMLRNAAGGPVGIQMCQEAADALEQLQAENDRLQAELEKEEAARKKQADILYELRGQKYEQTTAIDQLQAENDRLRRERDAAVEDLNAIIGDIEEIRRGYGVDNGDADSAFADLCGNYCANKSHRCYVEAEKYRCNNFKWRGPKEE